MRFWDSSAIIPLLVRETSSASARAMHRTDREMSVWWGAEVECVSALVRREREGLPHGTINAALERLDAMATGWNEVDPVAAVRRTARRLVRVHPLRAADALQLAAAIAASEGDASTLPFVCVDDRLIEAARREGFSILDPRAS